MADTKLSALTELAAAPATGDELYIRDISELAADESKRITWNNLFLNVDLPGTLDVTGIAIFDDKVLIGHTTGLLISNNSPFQILGTSGALASMAMGRFSNSASGVASYNVLKSRATVIGSQAIVLDNDNVGQFKFLADDGVDYSTQIAVFSAEVDDALPVAGFIGGALVFATGDGVLATPTEAMRIDRNQRLGIGTAAPNARLEIALDTNTSPTISADTAALFTQASLTGDDVNISLIAGATGNTRIHFGDTADENIGMIDYDHNSNAMIFVTNTSEQMRIASDGKVGIGSIAPVKDLHIASTVPTIRLSDSDAGTDQAVSALIEFWRGETTNRVAFLAMASSSNDIFRLATEYAAGEIRLSTGSNVDALIIDSSQNITVTGLSTFGANILSDTANTDDLGTDAVPWRTAYLGTSLVFDQTTRNVTIIAAEPATLARTYTIPDFGAADSFVALAATQTLTNKSIDSDNNTITNLVNADIKATAAIAYSKLAALTDGNILVGNGSNVAVSVNPSGDVDVSNAGVFSIAADVIVDADVKSDAAISGSKLQAAGLANSGAVELATAAETTTGTDAGRALTPDGLAGSDVMGGRTVQVVAFDFGTDVTTGDGKFYFVVDQRLAGMNIVSVRAKNITAGVTGQQDVQLRNVTAAADILSTKLVTATTATLDDGNAVISAIEDDLTLDDLIAVDVDAVHSGTAPKGLIIIIGTRLP